MTRPFLLARSVLLALVYAAEASTRAPDCCGCHKRCDAIRVSEDKSAESRAVVHKRMDELVSRVAHLETGMSELREDVTEMKPVTEDVKRWKLMGIGALGVIGIGGMVLGVTFADAIRRISFVLVGKG